MPVIVKYTCDTNTSQITMSEDKFKDFSSYLEDNPDKQIGKMAIKDIMKDLEVVVYNSDIDLSSYLTTTKENLLVKIVNELEKSKHYEECYSIIRDAIVYGVFRLSYGMIAPYTHGYELFYRDENNKTTSLPYYTEKTLKDIINETYNELYDRRGYTYQMFKELIPEINLLKEKYKRSHPALDDHYHVNTGYEFTNKESYDNLINGQYSGTYATMTPVSQNTLSSILIVLKGLGSEKSREKFKQCREYQAFVND